MPTAIVTNVSYSCRHFVIFDKTFDSFVWISDNNLITAIIDEMLAKSDNLKLLVNAL